jgi:hypothetical protein
MSDIATDLNRIVREAISEPNKGKQVGMLLQWVIDKGNAEDLFIVPPLDKMLGIGGVNGSVRDIETTGRE